MAKDIKTKKDRKGDIKQLNRNTVGVQKIKNTAIKTRNEISEINSNSKDEKTNNEVNYATNKITQDGKKLAEIGLYNYNKLGKKSVIETKNNMIKAKDSIDQIKMKYAQYKMIKLKEKEVNNKIITERNQEFVKEEINNNAYNEVLKQERFNTSADILDENTNIKIKNTKQKIGIKQKNELLGNKPKGKTSSFIKTMKNTEVPIIKTSNSKENIIGNTNLQKTTTQINNIKNKLVKDTKTIKKIFEKILFGLKALVRGSKAIMMALFAGGWIFGLIIIIIMLIGLLCSSTFGIFFANEGVDNSKKLKDVVREINTEFSQKLSDIQNSNPHDDYEITSNRAKIKDVIAVYAVKVAGSDDGQEVITLTEEKEAIFKQVFWDMNQISHHIENYQEQEIHVDSKGREKVVTVTQRRLCIQVTSKTAYEMADIYHFNRKQRKQLEELLDEKYANLWSSLLSGSSAGNSAIVEIAETQIGNVGGQPYWSWYGFPSRVSWCACFVSWCANECGFIDSGIIPMFAACQNQGITWFQACGLWQGKGYVPNTGDIIFFDWEGDGHSDHVGIVEYVEDGVVHTIEGNSNDSCARRQYSVDSNEICGYGVPMYE